MTRGVTHMDEDAVMELAERARGCAELLRVLALDVEDDALRDALRVVAAALVEAAEGYAANGDG